MKKVLSLAMVLCLLFCVSALAENTLSSGGSNSADTTVTYTAEAGYVVTIPASVTITAGSGSLTLKLGAATIFQDAATGIQVTVGSASYTVADNCFYMSSGANKLAYTIKDASSTLIAANGVAAQWLSANRSDVVLTLTSETPTFAGEYSDTLTFTVAPYSITP